MKLKYILLPSLLFCLQSFTDPTNRTWQGTTSSMSLDTNWNPNGTPLAQDSLTFPIISQPPPNPPLESSIINDIPGAYQLGLLTFNDAYTITGNQFFIASQTGSVWSFTAPGTNINLQTSSPGILLDSSSALTITNSALEGSNTISSVIQGDNTTNLNLTQGLLILSPQDASSNSTPNQYSGSFILGQKISPAHFNIATLQADGNGAIGSQSYAPSIAILESSILDLNNYDTTLNYLSGNLLSHIDLGSATLTITNATGESTFYGLISGTGNLEVQSSMLTLMEPCTYTGTTTLQDNVAFNVRKGLGSTTGVSLGNSTSLAFGSTQACSTPIELSGGTSIISVNEYDVLFTGSISGSGSLQKMGRGTLTFNNPNAPISLIIAGGTIETNAWNTIAQGGPNSIVFDVFGGTIRATETMTIDQSITLSQPATIDTPNKNSIVTLSGPISGGSPLIKEGQGTLILSALGNNFSGKTQINNGTLSVSATTFPSSSPQLIFSVTGNGVLQLMSDFPTFTPSIVLMANGTIDTNGFNMTVSNVVAGQSTQTLFKEGSGILTFSGANIYKGPTQVNAGTLQAGSPLAFTTSSALRIQSGATLDFQSFASSLNDLNNSGTVTCSNTITAASYTQSSTGILELNFATNQDSPVGNILSNGKITLAGSLNIMNTGGYSPPTTFDLTLIKSQGAGKNLKGVFSSVATPPGFGKLVYDYSENQVFLEKGKCDGTWISPSNDNWGSSSNWSSGCVPGVTGEVSDRDTATFEDIGNAPAVTVILANEAGNAAQSVTLHHITFNSSTTTFTIEQFNNFSVINLNTPTPSSPSMITLTQGNALIDTQIMLSSDTNMSLSSGTLTLGPKAIINSETQSLKISEGQTTGTLINYGSISPAFVRIEGNTINNFGTIQPNGSVFIQELSGVDNPLVIHNSSIISPILSFTMNSGTLINTQEANLGSLTAEVKFNGGTINTSGQITAYNYTQNAPATLILNLSETSSNVNITADNQAKLGGSLIVRAYPNYPVSSTQIIDLVITSTGVSSQFSSISLQNFPSSVIPNITYLHDRVQLSTKPTIPAHFIKTSHIATSSIKQHNAFARRKCFQLKDRLVTSPYQPVEQKETLSLEVSHPAESKNPSHTHYPPNPVYALSRLKDQDSNSPITTLASDATPTTSSEIATSEINRKPGYIFAGPTGSFGHINVKKNQAGLKYTAAGGLLGADYLFSNEEKLIFDIGVGLLLQYQRQWGHGDNNTGNFNSHILHGSLFSTLIPKAVPALSLETILGLAYAWDRLNRMSGIDDLDKAKSKTNEKIFNALLGLEYSFSPLKHFSFTPFLYLEYAHNHIDGFKESGAGIYNLSTEAQTLNSLSTLLGGRTCYHYTAPKCSLTIELDAEWIREYLDHDRSITFTPFTITTEPTSVVVFGTPKNSALLALNILAGFNKGWEIEANGTIQFNSSSYNTSFYLGFGKHF